MKTIWQPTLSDQRVLLKPLETSDFEALYQVASDPAIWEQHPAKERYRREVFQSFFEEAMASNGAFLIKDLESGKVIGSSRYKPVEMVDSAVEIGWSFLAKAYWGTGMNKRIKALMLDYAFSQVDYVVFYIAIDNVRSQKAVEKLGAKRISDFHLPLVKKSPMDYTHMISAQEWMKNAHEK